MSCKNVDSFHIDYYEQLGILTQDTFISILLRNQVINNINDAILSFRSLYLNNKMAGKQKKGKHSIASALYEYVGLHTSM